MLSRTSGSFDDSFNQYWILGEPLGDKRNALWDGQSSTELVHITFLGETIVKEIVKIVCFVNVKTRQFMPSRKRCPICSFPRVHICK